MYSYSIRTLDELKEFLYQAMRLEHATIPPYLTALYSIKPGVNQDATQVLRVIVVEEMLHLTIAANILNAIGGTPDLTRPDFAVDYPASLPDGETDFKVGIQAFGREALATFLKIERPAQRPIHLVGKGLIHRKTSPHTTALGNDPRHEDLHFYSIGEFYSTIAEGIKYLEAEAHRVGTTIFTGDRSRQITSEYYYSGGGELFAVTDLKSALEATELIIEQGEGDGGGIYDDNEHELAHYYRFDELVKGRYYQKGDQPGHPTGPQLQVDWEGAYPIKANLKVVDIDIKKDPELREAATAFNTRYGEFLQLLTRAYNGQPTLLLEAVPIMFEFRNMILELIRNPLTNHPGKNGCPTYEIPGSTKQAAVTRQAEVRA
ncbi:ferritin-like protein (plasmid) [Rhizobium gallicum bv. gallicum R602sp]|uniref:Ferritin-like protein n=1 Tax=Rhizobium gallicum bv. gallicum R602sp TaxID=1041138 RepID=A0A0B4X8T2_9HYPH|nr:ferritin-like protein [Rhizobium gallicum]AJD44394.1 ferritin-like protein [Rhizobium gallicum bv. gallicum R602sp]